MVNTQHLNPYRSLSSKFGTYLDVDALGDEFIKNGLLSQVIKTAKSNQMAYLRLSYAPTQWQRDISGWYIPLETITKKYTLILEQMLNAGITPIITLNIPQALPDWSNGDYHIFLRYILDAHKQFIVDHARQGIIWESPEEPNLTNHWFNQNITDDRIVDEWTNYCHQLYEIIWQYDHESIFLTGDLYNTPQFNYDNWQRMIDHDLLDTGTALSLHLSSEKTVDYLHGMDRLQWNKPMVVSKYGFGTNSDNRVANILQTTFILDMYRLSFLNYQSFLASTEQGENLFSLANNDSDQSNNANNQNNSNGQQRPTIICFGDSITWGDTGGHGRTTASYPSIIAEKLNLNVINAGICGAQIDRAIQKDWDYEIDQYQDQIKNCQLMTVMFGVNDFDWSNETLTELQTKYDQCLSRIQAINPEIKIIGMIPLHEFDPNTGQSRWDINGHGGGGYTLHQLATAIEQVLSQHHALIIDWSALEQNTNRLADHWVHPNQDLYNEIANILSSLIQTQLNIQTVTPVIQKPVSTGIHTSQPKNWLQETTLGKQLLPVLSQLTDYYLIQPLINDGVNCVLHYFNGSQNKLVGWTFQGNQAVTWGNLNMNLTNTPQIFDYQGVIPIPFERAVQPEDLRNVMNYNIDHANAILAVFDGALITGSDNEYDAISWITAHRYDRQFYEQVQTAFKDLAQRLSLVAGYFTGSFDADTGDVQLPDLWLPDTLAVDQTYLRHINENWVLVFKMLNQALQLVQTTTDG